MLADRRIHQSRKGVKSSHSIMQSESKHRISARITPHRGRPDAERFVFEGDSRHGARKDHIGLHDPNHYKPKRHLQPTAKSAIKEKLRKDKRKKAPTRPLHLRGGFARGPGENYVGGAKERKDVQGQHVIGQWFGVADDTFGEVTYDATHMETKQIRVIDFLKDDAIDPNEEKREELIKKTGPKLHAEGTFIHERHVALREYDRYIRKERRSRRRVLDKALLDIDDEDVTITGKQRQSIAVGVGMLNEKALIDIDEEDTTTRARNSMVDDHGENHMAEGELIAKGRHKTKGIPRRSQEAKDAEHVKDQLSDLPLWEPWFIHTMTIVQLVVLCVMLFHSFGRDEFAKWGIRTTPTYLIRVAAMFAPCMREDASVIKKAKDQACAECGPINPKCKPFGGSLPTAQALTAAPGAEGSSNSKCDGAKMAKLTDAAACDMSTKLDSAKCLQMLDNAVAAACITSEALTTVDAFGVDNFFGQSVAQGERCWGCPAECPIPFDEKPAGTAYTCCTLQYKRYGMMTVADCFKNKGTPLYDESNLVQKDVPRLCDHPSEPVVLRPCCVGNTGTCHLYTKSQCVFHSGVFHETSQLCSEVSCLGGTCAIYWNKNASTGAVFKTEAWGDTPELYQNYPRNIIKNPNQWWRMIFSLGTHSGVVHYVLCMTLQWTIGCQIERTAGWLRVLCIYFISGIGGYMISGLFDPTNSNTGSDPAVFGLLAVVCVELFQNWKLVPNPRWEATKLAFFMIVAFFLGTLPFVDNYSHLGGFIFGLLSAMIFLPYITFGKWDFIRKRAMLLIAIPVLFTLGILVLVSFYKIQNTDWCVGCHKFNCVEYHRDIKCGEHDYAPSMLELNAALAFNAGNNNSLIVV